MANVDDVFCVFVCCVFTCRVRLHLLCCSNKHRKETPTDIHTHQHATHTENKYEMNHANSTTHKITNNHNECTDDMHMSEKTLAKSLEPNKR